MKKRALAILMAALTATTMFAVPTFAADYSGEDPQLEKNIKILTIWAEDNDSLFTAAFTGCSDTVQYCSSQLLHLHH